MGSVNMKGFVTSLQKKGKLHHSVLVEQVRVMCSYSVYLWFFFFFFSFNLFFMLAFLLKSTRKRCPTVFYPNANRQRSSVRTEVGILENKMNS